MAGAHWVIGVSAPAVVTGMCLEDAYVVGEGYAGSRKKVHSIKNSTSFSGSSEIITHGRKI
jgi:hypothetical protein